MQRRDISSPQRQLTSEISGWLHWQLWRSITAWGNRKANELNINSKIKSTKPASFSRLESLETAWIWVSSFHETHPMVVAPIHQLLFHFFFNRLCEHPLLCFKSEFLHSFWTSLPHFSSSIRLHNHSSLYPTEVTSIVISWNHLMNPVWVELISHFFYVWLILNPAHLTWLRHQNRRCLCSSVRLFNSNLIFFLHTVFTFFFRRLFYLFDYNWFWLNWLSLHWFWFWFIFQSF